MIGTARRSRSQRREGAEQRQSCGHGEGRPEARDVTGTGAQRAVRGEHGGRHGHPEPGAEALPGAHGAGRRADVLRPHGAEGRRRGRGQRRRDPDAGQQQRAGQRGIAGVRCRGEREPAQAQALRQHPGGEHGPAAHAVRQRACERRHGERGEGPRQQPQPRGERRLRLGLLEELRDEERRGVDRRGEQDGSAGGRGEPGRAQQPGRQDRGGGPALPDGEPGGEDGSRSERGGTGGVGACGGGRPCQPPGEREHAPREQREPGSVAPVAGAVRLGQSSRGQHRADQPDGHGQPEDRVPAGDVREGGADERSRGDRETARAAPEAEDVSPPRHRVRRREDRQAQGHHRRRSQPLHRSPGQQRGGTAREGATGRRGGEDRESGGEDPAAAVPVAECGGRDDPDGVGEQVGGDDALPGAEAGPQVGPDRWQRGRDDERVQPHHERRQAGEGQRPARTGHVEPSPDGGQTQAASSGCHQQRRVCMCGLQGRATSPGRSRVWVMAVPLSSRRKQRRGGWPGRGRWGRRPREPRAAGPGSRGRTRTPPAPGPR